MFFAGFSAKPNLPVIEGAWGGKSGYMWCPLRNRVDLDRVRRQIAMSGLFQNVRPLGSGGGPFKEKKPWGHMNPFQSSFKWQGQTISCGITDEGKGRLSTSGARLYVRGPEQMVDDCCNLVVGCFHSKSLPTTAPTTPCASCQMGEAPGAPP